MAYDFLQYGVFVLHEMYIFKELNDISPKHSFMKRTYRLLQQIAISLLLCLLASNVYADRILFSYDASGNRVYSEKEILIRGEQSQEEDKKPRRQDLSLCQITIYPNPTEGQLSVEITGAESFDGASITIYTTSGSIIYYDSQIEAVNDIDLTLCQRGMYLMIIRIDGETSSWKIIKI